MGAAVGAHTALGPGVALAGTLAAAVEDGRYAGIRLLSGQGSNEIAGFGVGRQAVLSRSILGDRQPRVIPALPMDHEIDRVADDLGHDLDDRRPQDVLARLGGRPRMMP